MTPYFEPEETTEVTSTTEQPEPTRPYRSKFTAQQAMALPRHERRRLGKMNVLKIPGSTKPITKVALEASPTLNEILNSNG